MPKKWHKVKCIFCSLCTTLCPSEAFCVNEERSIEYFALRCLGCGECLPALGCPRRAIE